MRSNYKRIGDFIKQVSLKNTEGEFDELLGINIDKFFMPSVANVIGTDLKRYKVVKKHQFACNRMHVGRDYRIPIALSRSETPFIVSPAYTVFEITDTSIIDPDYLMMWFSRPEFDREVWFHTDADVRGGLPWGMFCDIELPIPSIEKQRAIVKEYNTVVNRIKLNEELNRKLEETAQAIYKEWFVDFEFPITEESCPELASGSPHLIGKPYKSSGGEMVWNEELDKEIPDGWEIDDFQSVTSVTSGKGLKSNLIGENPIYGAGGITGYTSKWLFKETILITGRVGTHGKVFIEYGKCWPTDNTLVLIPSFLYYSYFILKTLNFDELNKGGVQALLTQTDIKQIKILKPIAEIEKYENLVFPLFKRMENNLKKKSALNNLKDLLLSKMTKVDDKKEMG